MRNQQQKALAEQGLEFRLWKKWRRERVAALLAGPSGEAVRALLTFTKTMASPSALIDFVRAGPWCAADNDTRFEVLALLDAAIVARRENMGLAPFDDALPGQPDNLFLILRRELLAPSSIHDSRLMAAPPGAEPGSIDDATAKIQEEVT